jgi:phenylalanyl-tRNA synthetase alpha chain
MNIPQSILDKRGSRLHNIPGNPICLIKQRIYHFFNKIHTNNKFKTFDELNEVVTVENNFDLLCIPKNHPARSKSDTYYVDEDHVLMTHTSAHQNDLLTSGERQFLVSGSVFRKDEIDRFHYPVFHQMEGVVIINDDMDPEQELKSTLSKLVEFLFPNKQYRFNTDYFPFTINSYEVEVLLQLNGGEEKWVEILGSGVIHPDILTHNKIEQNGFAFGLGLERLAMIFYSIPDIRLFWSTNVNFIKQFENHNYLDDITFIPYPKLPSIYKDISFWLNTTNVTNIIDTNFEWTLQNDFYDIVRDVIENVENVELIDKFYHPKKQLYSHCWRIVISPNNEESNPGKFNDICNKQMEKIKCELIDKLQLECRM